MEANSFDFHKTKNLIDLSSNRMICLLIRGTLRLKTYGGLWNFFEWFKKHSPSVADIDSLIRRKDNLAQRKNDEFIFMKWVSYWHSPNFVDSLHRAIWRLSNSRGQVTILEHGYNFYNSFDRSSSWFGQKRGLHMRQICFYRLLKFLMQFKSRV